MFSFVSKGSFLHLHTCSFWRNTFYWAALWHKAWLKLYIAKSTSTEHWWAWKQKWQIKGLEWHFHSVYHSDSLWLITLRPLTTTQHRTLLTHITAAALMKKFLAWNHTWWRVTLTVSSKMSKFGLSDLSYYHTQPKTAALVWMRNGESLTDLTFDRFPAA